ncbi:hypothetical protein P152DRAFT_426816 [Eremomyces bilateralis CBS 781.70]|uniref:MT-A70-domain-containing protein n=1 Tax=Eremomyces bilateralis CBS 781.70 TaxID=1392243 RepID=A0A6G1GH39_9PEZI|nr:uncharacterized protein P152DRAFT_426816 [Eremomyces bilateralis CBS 781.70]KAF1817180.1 hypothetical protein P152DRAFT_426816 [Eremomyces bilateralis CBS 781.70]
MEEHGTSPILYEADDHSIALMDIPTSIAKGQDIFSHPIRKRLLSSEPLPRPFPSQVAGSPAKRRKLTGNTSDPDVHRELWPRIEKAVHEVRKTHSGDWCLPRAIASKKRRASSKGDEDSLTEPDHTYWSTLSGGKAEKTTLFSASSEYSFVLRPLIEPSEEAQPQSYEQIIANPSSKPSLLLLPVADDKSELLKSYFSLNPTLPPTPFFVPPKSVALLSTIPNRPLLSHATRNHLSPSPRSGQRNFDFILLDPPWPNASARRAKSYQSQSNNSSKKSRGRGTSHAPPQSNHHIYCLESVTSIIDDIGLEQLISPNGYIAVWITNKPTVRSAILDDGGFFHSLGIRWFEEWVWVKMTVSGDSDTTEDGAWRRPYECLLIGQVVTGSEDAEKGGQEVRRRTLLAVPDVHSRKPNLKRLVERWLLNGAGDGEYNAMEIFARNTTAGWWAWGDEALRFNWTGWWEGREDGMSGGGDNNGETGRLIP